MPSDTFEVLPKRGALVIDKYGVSTLSEINPRVGVGFKNQSPKSVYVKAILIDSNGNWKFANDTTEIQLGEAQGFATTYFEVSLKRALPSDEVEESFSIIFEIYKESNYSTKVDTITLPVNVTIADFRNSSNWTMSFLNDFDDGTTQGWSGWTITNVASVKANGYSLYASSKTDSIKTVSKTVTLPNANNKIVMFFYVAAKVKAGTRSGWVKDVTLKVGDDVIFVYAPYILKAGSDAKAGWFQFGADLTDYKGQEVTLTISMNVHGDEYGTDTIAYAYLDEIGVAYK